MKHTPGPWKIYHDWNIVAGMIDDEVLICECNHDPYCDPPVPGTANTQLIAACPIMYDYITEQAKHGDEKALQILNSIKGK